MPSTPVHHAAVDSSPWDGPTQTAKLQTPLTTDVGNHTFAWRDATADPTLKGSWKFIHHFVGKTGLPGSASTMACSTAVGVLNGARKGTTIPDGDRQGVYDHLTAHLLDAGVRKADLPVLKTRSAAQSVTCPTCDGTGKMAGGKTPSQNLPCPDCGGEGEVSMTTTSDRSARAALYGSDDLQFEIRHTTERRNVRQMAPDVPQFEMREIANGTGGTSLRFTGYASVTDRPYEMLDAQGSYTETITRSAFNKTLKDGADVVFLVNHSGVALARTRSGSHKLSADNTGLYSEATFDPSRPDVQIVRSAVQAGDLDSMSFAFQAVRQSWNDTTPSAPSQSAHSTAATCRWSTTRPVPTLRALWTSEAAEASTDRTSTSGYPPGHTQIAHVALRQAKLRHPPVGSKHWPRLR